MTDPTDSDRKTDLNAIRGGFVSQGSSLAAWCAENGLHRPNVVKAILGQWSGPKAERIREAVQRASRGEDHKC